METVVVYKHKRVGRVSKVIFAVIGITIAAAVISFFGNAEQLSGAKRFWNEAFKSLGTTMSLQTVEIYSPSLEFGLYDRTGRNPYTNWQMNLIHHSLGRKQNTLIELVEELSQRAQVENEEEAELLNQTIVVDRALKENNESAEVGIIHGENYFEDNKKEMVATEALALNKQKIDKLKNSLSLSYLLDNFYIVDSSTSINKQVFNVEKLLKKDCGIKHDSDKPQILIYHTHSSEAFIDSDGSKSDSVVAVGKVLAKSLTDDYDFNVIHDETCYDVINGKLDRSKAYDMSQKGIKKILKKYPSIEVLIDLHRNASSGKRKQVSVINGKNTANIMFFNGLSRKASGESRPWLSNPNLQGNLAFSLKMKMKAMELYPNLTTKTYLKGYRYNLHLRAKSLLIELGSEKNTLEEAKNAMEPLADVLNQVLNE